MKRYVCQQCKQQEVRHPYVPYRAEIGQAPYQCPVIDGGCVFFADFTLEDVPDTVTNRKMVYIAGPISKGDLAHNINQATAAFRELALAGLSPLCPQWSCFSTGALVAPTSAQVYAVATVAGCDLPHQTWIEIDLAFVERADAVLRLPGESTGADAEVRHAMERGIPVFTSVADVIAWAREGV